VYHQLGVGFLGERRGYFSEYRYDALGRRVLVRTRRDGLCKTSQSAVDCTSGIERFVWAGDNIVWEMRGPGGNAKPAERLEQVDAPGVEYGIVGYTHAGGVDRPLVAYKTAGGNVGAVVVPHMNGRGLFSLGTTESGAASTVPVEWPGFRTTAYHSKGETQESTKNWMGSLLEGQRDAGGQMYMRNRYYDPATGQFTQTDPIGIAGGLNTYGFAAGDPVTYIDPYGLCPPVRRCIRNIVDSHYKLGDMLHAGRHLFLGALQQAVGRNANHHQLVVAGTIVITREANRLTAARAGRYDTDRQNAFRHIYGSCQLTRMFGEREARETANAHERTLHEEDEAEAADSKADQKNNNLGYDAGSRSNLNHWSCEEIADENIRVEGYWSADDFR
jgi:RHS repeat-associated protein